MLGLCETNYKLQKNRRKKRKLHYMGDMLICYCRINYQSIMIEDDRVTVMEISGYPSALLTY